MSSWDSLFEAYASDFGESSLSISRYISDIPNLSGEERQQAIRQCETEFKDAERLVQAMSIEVLSLPKSKSATLQERVKEFKATLGSHRKEFKTAVETEEPGVEATEERPSRLTFVEDHHVTKVEPPSDPESPLYDGDVRTPREGPLLRLISKSKKERVLMTVMVLVFAIIIVVLLLRLWSKPHTVDAPADG